MLSGAAFTARLGCNDSQATLLTLLWLPQAGRESCVGRAGAVRNLERHSRADHSSDLEPPAATDCHSCCGLAGGLESAALARVAASGQSDVESAGFPLKAKLIQHCCPCRRRAGAWPLLRWRSWRPARCRSLRPSDCATRARCRARKQRTTPKQGQTAPGGSGRPAPACTSGWWTMRRRQCLCRTYRWSCGLSSGRRCSPQRRCGPCECSGRGWEQCVNLRSMHWQQGSAHESDGHML